MNSISCGCSGCCSPEFCCTQANSKCMGFVVVVVCSSVEAVVVVCSSVEVVVLVPKWSKVADQVVLEMVVVACLSVVVVLLSVVVAFSR